jgi:glycosyltransferase involved in cell wall biosynthesis
MTAITLFTPSFADENSTNAQNLTVKEIVSRLPSDRFRVIMIYAGEPDARIASRTNTKLIPYFGHGNTAHLLVRLLLENPDIYFYPRDGPLDRLWFLAREHLSVQTRLITHVVSAMNLVRDRDPLVKAILTADAVCANSTHLAETLRQRFTVEAKTIFNGIDRRFFFPGLRSERPPVRVLYAGSFQRHKRPQIVIHQAARFPDAMFRLAGTGPTEAACRELAADLHCCNVVFLGHISPQNLGEEMRRADIFLFPSVEEGHPQVLGQAAACGLPAIAMNSYQPEYVVNGRTGYLLDDEAEIADKLAMLLTNSVLRKSMSEAASEHAKLFDWDRIAEQWMAVFERVAQGMN